MIVQLQVPYPEMVEKLWKPDTLPMQYLHATVGLVGEMLELFEAEWKAMKRENFIEELGDMAFYLERMLQWNGLHLENFIDVPKEIECHLFIAAGELLDCAKRFAIYGKELEEERFNRFLYQATSAFFAKLRLYCLSLAEVQKANQEKLLTGEKARYKLGLFSNEQAITRADKVAGS